MKIIKRRGVAASAGRILRARQQANADAYLKIEKEKPRPVFWRSRLTGEEIYY